MSVRSVLTIFSVWIITTVILTVSETSFATTRYAMVVAFIAGMIVALVISRCAERDAGRAALAEGGAK